MKIIKISLLLVCIIVMTSLVTATTSYSNLYNPFTGQLDFVVSDSSLNKLNNTRWTINNTWIINSSNQLSFNTTTGDERYIQWNDEANLNVNESTYWSGLTGWSSIWFNNIANILTFNESKMNQTIEVKNDAQNISLIGYSNVNDSLLRTENAAFNVSTWNYVNTQINNSETALKTYSDNNDTILRNEIISFNSSTWNYVDSTFVTSVTGSSPIVSSGGLTPTISATIAKDLVTTSPLTGAIDNIFLGTDSDITLAITMEGDLVTTSPITGSVNNIFPGTGTKATIAIPVATSSADGYLDKDDWTIFNNKADVNTFNTTNQIQESIWDTVTDTKWCKYTSSTDRQDCNVEPITNNNQLVNGAGYSTTVGTVTSVTGTSPIVSSGGATPAISATIAKDLVTTAPLTGSTDNVLLGTDSDLTIGITVAKDLVTTAPLTGGTDNILTGADADITIAMPVATTSADGYLSQTDWDTFNDKYDSTSDVESAGFRTAVDTDALILGNASSGTSCLYCPNQNVNQSSVPIFQGIKQSISHTIIEYVNTTQDIIVVNNEGNDVDFRVEMSITGNGLYVGYDNDFVGIASNSVTSGLENQGTLSVGGLMEMSSINYHKDDLDTYQRYDPDKQTYRAGGVDMLTLLEDDSQDKVNINEDSNDVDFQVEGDNDVNLLYTNAGNDRVGIGTATPSAKLDVQGDINTTGNIELQATNKFILSKENNACIFHNGSHIIVSNNLDGVTC